MTVRADGSAECDRCGRELENGGVHEAAIISVMLDDGQAQVFHLCSRKPDPCTSHVLTKAALAHAVSSYGGQRPALFHLEEATDEPVT